MAPQNDALKRYLDAGMAFTQLSREKAEEFVKELVKQGEVRRKETEETIEALLERSRKNTEDLVAIVRQEIADQLRNIGLEDLVKRAGLPDAAGKVDKAADKAAAAVAPKKAPAKKATTAAPAKKAAAKKTAAKKAPSAAKKSTKKS